MEVSDTRLRGMRLRGADYGTIALRTGLTIEAVEERLTEIWRSAQQRSTDMIDPTPETIQLLASVERLKWTPEEERRRRGHICDWTPPDASPGLAKLMIEAG